MKLKASLILFLALQSASTFACLNGDTKYLKNGFLLYIDREGRIPLGHRFPGRTALLSAKHDLDSLYKTTKDIDFLSDEALVMILLKDYKDAIKIYEQIEKRKPGRYSTASNMGTAYELLGDNENALKWIKRSVEIDENSHENSEWIHVKILEAKLKGVSAINSDFLLNTNFGEADLPRTTMKKDQVLKLAAALYYQLNERVSFIKGKDQIIAQLLFDLGNVLYLGALVSDAKQVYNLAGEYGYNKPLLAKRIAACTK